ncbi:MAG: porin [Bacteroidia bacterium]
MKKHYIYTLLFIMIGLSMQAQNPKLNKYTMGEGLKFTDNNNSTYTLTGFIQPSLEIKKYNSDSNDASYLRFRMRRLRFRFAGDLPKYKIEYRFQADFSGTPEVGDETNLALFDAWVAYNPNKYLQIKFGQSSNPTENLELLMTSNSLQLPERSRLTSAFAVAREFGIFVSGEFKASKNIILKPAVSLTNGDGPNTFNSNAGGFKYGGRLDILTFGKFNHFGQFRQVDMARELTPKLLIGFTYSKNNGVSSRRGEASRTINYLDNTGREAFPDYTKFGIDFLFKYKGFCVLGEYIQSRANVPNTITTRVRNDGTTSNSFLVNNVQDVSNYVKGRMMLGKAYNIQAGYLFRNRISIDARYTQLKADEHSFLNNPTFYNRPKYYTLGVSKYLMRNYGFKIQGSITYAELAAGSVDIKGSPINNNELISNMMVTFTF